MFLYEDSSIASNINFENSGIIHCGARMEVGSKTRTPKFGLIFSDTEIKAVISAINEIAEAERAMRESSLISKGEKIVVEVTHHKDHYLNTITDHYIIEELGFRRFSHRTETGYIFQKRTTEKTTKEFETDGYSEAIQEMAKELRLKRDFIKRLREQLQRKLKALAKSRASQLSMLQTILASLKDAGIEIDELGEDTALYLMDTLNVEREINSLNARDLYIQEALESWRKKNSREPSEETKSAIKDLYGAQFDRRMEYWRDVFLVPSIGEAIAEEFKRIYDSPMEAGLDYTPILGFLRSFNKDLDAYKEGRQGAAATVFWVALGVAGEIPNMKFASKVGKTAGRKATEAAAGIANGAAAKSATAGISSGFTTHDLRAYLRQVEQVLGLELPSIQRSMLAEAMRKGGFAKLDPSSRISHSRAFQDKTGRSKLIEEWEKQTGRLWPSQERMSSGRVLTTRQDAHHIIPQEYGGPHTWWNIHPMEFPSHQKYIHGREAKLTEILRTVGGD